MFVMICISNDAPSTSSAAQASMAPVRANPKLAPTSTGLTATNSERGRTATAQARNEPLRTCGTSLEPTLE
jgi:hypothetical protein